MAHNTAHKKNKSANTNAVEIVSNKPHSSKAEKQSGRRNMFVFGIFILLTLSIAGIANWRTLKSYKLNSALAGSPNSTSATMLSMPPSMPADRPSKEFVYSGGSLLATVEPFREAPDDFAVWRPGSGVWYILSGQNSSSSQQQWGIENDLPAPGDFDGDGKADFSVFRPSNGAWWIISGSTGNHYTFTLGGQSGDKPAIADYDGDGKADAAVFQPSTGFWLINKSGGGPTVTTAFGYGTDTPRPADFDGDGRADLAVWRGGEAQFYVQKSTDNIIIGFNSGTWQTSDEPIVGDFDGDGKADPGTWRASDGVWRIYLSSTGSYINQQFGQAGDKTVAGDYDRDGKTDIAVWRPSNGVWYVSKSSANGAMLAVQWGQAGDYPVPAPYRR